MLAMIDSLIGAIGLAVILWVVVLGKGVGTGPTFASLVNVSYPVFDILIVTLVARLALAHRSREPAQWWLVVGFSAMLATDLTYAWLVQQLAGCVQPAPRPRLGDQLHRDRSGGHALQHGAPDPSRSTWAMLTPTDVLWLGVPLLAVPVLMLIPGHDRPVDQLILGVAAIALAIPGHAPDRPVREGSRSRASAGTDVGAGVSRGLRELPGRRAQGAGRHGDPGREPRGRAIVRTTSRGCEADPLGSARRPGRSTGRRSGRRSTRSRASRAAPGRRGPCAFAGATGRPSGRP